MNYLALFILGYYSKDGGDLVTKTVLEAGGPRSRCWTIACLVWAIFWFTANIFFIHEWYKKKEFTILLLKTLHPQDLITPQRVHLLISP